MGINSALIGKMMTPQRSWRKDEAFDAVFALRLFIAALMGAVFGAMGSEGYYYFIAFLMTTFFGAKSWLEYQNIDVEEMEASNNPGGDSGPTNPSLMSEGLGPSIPLFMLFWTVGYTLVSS